ncbi:MAG: amino acid adenylation domain-containing protein, partial [Chitinophagaceae bacterium]|nr:amino acid adenylation domain-containing protein [Chitinophagaceae bacterium]
QYGNRTITLQNEDLRDTELQDLPFAVKALADGYHKKLDIERGDLVKAVLIQTPTQDPHNRLLIIVHHLAIDGVSWRILLEDMEALLSLNSSGTTLNLPAKKSSYRQWYQALERYGKSNKLLQQKEYWQHLQQQAQPLETDRAHTGIVTAKDLGYYQASLAGDLTKQLLQDVSKVYRTEINDLLLAALAKTFNAQQKNVHLLIGLESHGREEIEAGIDINNTVGWFTTLYPVLLETSQVSNDDELLKSVKEQLRKIPGKGLGYGVLKYINAEPELQGADKWEIVFNYLGQLDNVVKGSGWLTTANEPVGSARSSEATIHEKIAINAQVQDGQLVVSWSFSTLHFSPETIEKLASEYISNVTAIIQHCLQLQQSNMQLLTPSDIGLGREISYKELDAFLQIPVNGMPLGEQVESIYRLSGLQQGMLFHSLYKGGTGAYTEQLSCLLQDANLDAFKKSWQSVVKNHSILRSAFFAHSLNVPVQCVFKRVEVPVEIIDLSGNQDNEQELAVTAFEKADRDKGFDLAQAPLMRLTLLKLTDGFRMVWTYHHLLSDGWSLPILMQEFLQAYDDVVAGNQPSPQNPDNYQDYIRYIENIDSEAEENYWRNHLKDLEEPTLLPFINSKDERNKIGGIPQHTTLQLTADESEALHHFAHTNRLTVNTIMQGIWAFMLAQYTGNNSVVFGIIVSGRPDTLSNVEQRVGLYINTLPFYAQIDEQAEVVSWLNNLQKLQVNSLEFQQTPLTNIQAWTGIPGDLFDSLLIFENYPVSEVLTTKKWSLQAGKIRIEEQTNYPLNIVIQNSGQVHISFHYNSNILQEFYVQGIRDQFQNVLSTIIDGAKKMNELSLLNATDEEKLIHGVNETNAEYSHTQTMAQLFEATAEKVRGNIAVIFREEKSTYQQINERANQLALVLRKKGVVAEKMVPICLQRSTEMIVAILGVLKAGGAYVPIDPQYPLERIRFILEDTVATIMIGDAEMVTRLSVDTDLGTSANGHKTNKDVEIIFVDDEKGQILEEASNPEPINTSRNLAYVIYTSGSTGNPKGVMIEHKTVINLITHQVKHYGVTGDDRILQFSNYAFDASVEQIMLAFATGATLVLIDKETLTHPEGLQLLMEKERITHLDATPGYIETLTAKNYPHLKRVVSGGEECSVLLAEKWADYVDFYNAYGPTETTVTALDFKYSKAGISNNKLPIGKPLGNIWIYVVDENGHLVPNGVVGEIWIGGESVARGYLNQPELTSAKFIENPFVSANGSRIYKTGDLGRRLADGTIEYYGRMDNQVKIRGYRIELGEIEQALMKSGLVKQAVVLAKTEIDGNKMLVGYVVADNDFDKQNVLLYLYKRLPEYMVPAMWVKLDKLPLTYNGKIDTRLLKSLRSLDIEKEYVAPETDTEKKLAVIWQKLLSVEKIGVHDNFFELGGNSLLAMRLVSYIENELKLTIPMNVIFHSRSIRDLSKYFEIQSDQNVVTSSEKFEVIDI